MCKGPGAGANLLDMRLEQSGEGRDRQRPNPQGSVGMERSLVLMS